jgi:hypothetical protein
MKIKFKRGKDGALSLDTKECDSLESAAEYYRVLQNQGWYAVIPFVDADDAAGIKYTEYWMLC